jgi:GNAT superfamily N-acetyltransferase
MYAVRKVAAQDVDLIQGYRAVSSFVEAHCILRCDPDWDGMGGLRLTEAAVDPPFTKNYANTEDDPIPMHHRWDTSEWGIFVATEGDTVVGGCVVAMRTEGVDMLEGRKDMAVLWDIRVRADCRGSGIGTKLFEGAASYAAQRGCKVLKIETQNVNVPACRFYRKQGCHLGGINIHAYAEFPEEVQLLWYRSL